MHAEASPKQSRKGEPCTSTTQLRITDSIAKSSKYARNSPQSIEINRAIAFHIAEDAVPLYTVEKPGFKHMIAKLNPRYEIWQRNTCRFVAPVYYQKESFSTGGHTFSHFHEFLQCGYYV